MKVTLHKGGLRLTATKPGDSLRIMEFVEGLAGVKPKQKAKAGAPKKETGR